MVPLFTQALTEPLTLSVWPLSPASAFCWRRSPPRNAAEPRAGSHSSQPPLEQVRHRAHRATVRCCQYVFSQPPINQVRIPFNKRTHLIQLRGGQLVWRHHFTASAPTTGLWSLLPTRERPQWEGLASQPAHRAPRGPCLRASTAANLVQAT